MPAAHEKSVLPRPLATGPWSAVTSPNCHDHAAIKPITSAMTAGQLTSPNGDVFGGSYSAGTSTLPRRSTKNSTSVMPAHGLIHTMIEAIQLSNEWAKLSDWMNAISTTDPTTPATAVTF